MYNDRERTLWVGNLSNEVTEELLRELFLQAGPLERVKKVSTYAFITYDHEVSVPYALELYQGIALFNRQLNIKAQGAQQDHHLKRNLSNSSRENESPYKHMRFSDDNLMRPPIIHAQHSYEDLLSLGDQMNIYNNVNNRNYQHGASTSIDLDDYDRQDNRRPRHDHNRHRDDHRRNFGRRDHGRKDYHNNRNNGNRFRRH